MSRSLKDKTDMTPQFKLEWRETDVFDIRGLIRQKEGWLTWNKETERMVVKKAAIHAHKFRFTDPDSFVGDVLIHAYRKINCYKIEHKNGIDRLCRNYAISVTRKKTLNTMSYDALNHAASDDETFESIFQDKERDLVEEIHTRDILLEVQEHFPVFFRAAAMKADGIPDFEIARDMGISQAKFKQFYTESQRWTAHFINQRHKDCMVQDVASHYGYSLEAFTHLPFTERRLLVAAYECDVLKVQEMPRGSNRGARVETYLKSVGLGGGFAWCAAFVTWCSKQADPNYHCPSSPAMAASWLKAKPKNRKDVQRGDLGGFINADGTGHVYLITRVEKNAAGEAIKLYTIEGNSNDEGSREGFEVCRRIRVWDAKTKVAG